MMMMMKKLQQLVDIFWSQMISDSFGFVSKVEPIWKKLEVIVRLGIRLITALPEGLGCRKFPKALKWTAFQGTLALEGREL